MLLYKTLLKVYLKAISFVIKLTNKQTETYSSKPCYFLEVKSFWLLNRSDIDAMDPRNVRNKALLIAGYDVSTLYADILHNKSKK